MAIYKLIFLIFGFNKTSVISKSWTNPKTLIFFLTSCFWHDLLTKFGVHSYLLTGEKRINNPIKIGICLWFLWGMSVVQQLNSAWHGKMPKSSWNPVLSISAGYKTSPFQKAESMVWHKAGSPTSTSTRRCPEGPIFFTAWLAGVSGTQDPDF